MSVLEFLLMDKRLLSYALQHHLKLGKCLMNNCKLCCNISNTSGCRHISDSLGLDDKNTDHSHINKNTDEFPRASGVNHAYELKRRQLSSGKIGCHEVTHVCDTYQPELISLESSGKTDSFSECDDQPKVLFQSNKRLSPLKAYSIHKRKCISSLVHKTYLNLKDNQLWPDQQRIDTITSPASKFGRKLLHNSKTMGLLNQDVNSGYLDRYLQTKNLKESSTSFGFVSEKDESSTSFNPSIKEHFNRNMYSKYQYPTSKEAARLSVTFPDPEELLSAVVTPMIRVDENCATHLLVTDHLKQHYWKAKLTLTSLQSVTVQGIHPDRHLAIRGAYLQMCEHLKDLGLIYQSTDGKWVPMTCDKVMTILEVLSKYGESSIGCSRGKGFKIILEKVKETRSLMKENIHEEKGNSVNNMKVPENSFENKPIGNRLQKITGVTNNCTCAVSGHENVCNAESITDDFVLNNVRCSSFCANNIRHGSGSSQMEMDDTDVADSDLHIPSSSVGHTSKPRWICIIHVGWPMPFSVQAEGISLPAALTIGYMAVITKLKMKNLLTYCNSSVSSSYIESIMVLRTKQHWQSSLRLLVDKTAIKKFNAEAEIFCDASLRGFGAFLSLKGTEKVSWLSEEWEEHQNIIHHFLTDDNTHLQSVLAELFAVVTAVFTWKHKLRCKRLLCFSDNVSVMRLVNSFVSEPLKPDNCRNSMDYMIYILQTTCLEHGIKLQATWLDRQRNWLADCLSRSDIVAFQNAVPEAAICKTKAKKLNIKEGMCIFG